MAAPLQTTEVQMKNSEKQESDFTLSSSTADLKTPKPKSSHLKVLILQQEAALLFVLMWVFWSNKIAPSGVFQAGINWFFFDALNR